MPSNPLPSPGSPAGAAQGDPDLPAIAAAVRDGHAPTLAAFAPMPDAGGGKGT